MKLYCFHSFIYVKASNKMNYLGFKILPLRADWLHTETERVCLGDVYQLQWYVQCTGELIWALCMHGHTPLCGDTHSCMHTSDPANWAVLVADIKQGTSVLTLTRKEKKQPRRDFVKCRNVSKHYVNRALIHQVIAVYNPLPRTHTGLHGAGGGGVIY